MDSAVGERQRLARPEELLGLAVELKPEVAINALGHDNARMGVATGLEPSGDFYGSVDQLEIRSRYVRSLEDRALEKWLDDNPERRKS